ncbi:MAG: M48 family metallopeptidase [Pseudomonadota bacterium]
MNLPGSAVTTIVLTTIVVDYLLNMLANWLNLRCIHKTIPGEFQSDIPIEAYSKSQEYLTTTTWFSNITASIDLLLVLLFWLLEGFPLVDGWVRGLGLGTVSTGLVYAAALFLLKGIATLPFSIYSTFVIEAKFGFNKTTPGLFAADLIKTVALSTLLGGVLLAGILSFLEYAGPYAWIICWAASTVFMVAVQYIIPTLVMPLFNRFLPLETGALRTAITEYATSINFPIDNIFVMDGSRRSSRSNAFFTGFGRHRRIVLFDTLINNHSTPELVAVLAHEMGHFKKHHILRRLGAVIIQMGIIYYLMSVCITIPGLFEAFFMPERSIYAGLIFFGLLYAPIDLILSMVIQTLSRQDEFEADRFAAQTVKQPEDLVTALKRLAADNLSNLTPHPFFVFLNYSHPPVLQRIQAIRSIG